MKETLHIIPLRIVKHNDRSDILTAFTLERGRMAFVQPAGKGREAARRRALMMPMALVECEVDVRTGRDVQLMSSPRPMLPLTALRSNPVRSSLAMFLAEVLTVVLRDSQPDATLWHYVAECIKILDSLPTPLLANFHITFMVRMTSIIGIEPAFDTFKSGSVFDMLEGRFRLSPPQHSHWLSGSEANMAASLGRITFANMHRFRLTRQERARLLDTILEYFSLHTAPLTNLRSLPVLRTLL